MNIDPQDEGLHACEEDETWQEGGYLAWFDPVAGVGGNHRIGNELNRRLANRWCGVYDAEGRQYRNNADQTPLSVFDGIGYECGSQRFFHDGHSPRAKVDEPECFVDLSIEDLANDAHWLDRSHEKLKGTIYSSHYNVHCRVNGKVRLGEREYDVNGFGWRDHSWGPRKWDSIACTRSIGGRVGDTIFQCTTWLGRDGTFIKRGYVGEPGRRVPIDDARFEVSVREDCITCTEARVVLWYGGEKITLGYTALGGVTGQTRERIGFESVGHVRLGDRQEGWGFIEINNNPRLGAAQPALVLESRGENGLIKHATRS